MIESIEIVGIRVFELFGWLYYGFIKLFIDILEFLKSKILRVSKKFGIGSFEYQNIRISRYLIIKALNGLSLKVFELLDGCGIWLPIYSSEMKILIRVLNSLIIKYSNIYIFVYINTNDKTNNYLYASMYK